MDRVNYGEFYLVKCSKCGQNYLVRTGESPEEAKEAHNRGAAQAEHDRIQDLSNREWESVLIRKVIPFPGSKHTELFFDGLIPFQGASHTGLLLDGLILFQGFDDV